jgi:hypothetical protein
MTINSPGITSVDVTQNYTLAMEIVTVRPSLTEVFSVPQLPGKLVGFYNGSTNLVELYTVNSAGLRYLKIL